MSLADPWSSSSSSNSASNTNEDASGSDSVVGGGQNVEPASLQFEDNFEPGTATAQGDRLPDSDSYLAALERRLKRIKTNPTVLQQLAERREACMQYLLSDQAATYRADAEQLDQLDEPVFNHELLRFIRPEQALSVAELVHLVKYDHLEPEEQGQEDSGKEQQGEESGTESSTSR